MHFFCLSKTRLNALLNKKKKDFKSNEEPKGFSSLIKAGLSSSILG